MGKFTVIPEDTFNGLQMDAGVLLTEFDPANPEVKDEAIICATTGGINLSCVPTYSDLGEDVDNCPNNMKELKHLDGWECKFGFTSLGTSARSIRLALGAADVDAETGAIIPRRNLKQTDFADIWWVGDKADGGMVAARLINALSTAGFTLQTTKNGKGQISMEITGHVSINDQDTMPMVLYSADADPFERVTVTPEADDVIMFDTLVADMQTGVAFDGSRVTGTLHYLDSGALVDHWGAGNFIGLHFDNYDPNATSIKVGLDPSQSSGLVEIINDPDHNGAFKVTNKDTQKFVVEVTDGVKIMRQTFDLTGLVCETE
jgi:hypothetical protein